MRITRSIPFLALLAGFVVACGGGDSSGPSGPRPASIAVNAGDAQSATVGTAVAIVPSVVVRDAAGSTIPGVAVTFSVVAGGGTITGSSATTDPNGLAAVGSWTLGTVAGANQLRASVPGLTPVTFTATGTPGAPAALAFLTTPSGLAANGVPLVRQPVVQLRDQYGNPSPQAGVDITASIDSGGGTLGGTVGVPSDPTGAAAFTDLVISGLVGNRVLAFAAAGLPALKSGAITLGPGPAATVTASSSTTLSGTVAAPVTPAPAALVSDQSGNPVPGIVVNFVVTGGNGSATGTTPVTNSSGIATVGSWTLGAVAGPNTMDAVVSGLAPVTFTATGGSASPTRLVVTLQPGTASAVNGQQIQPQPVVRLRDQFSNDVAQSGVMVTASISSGGGSLGGTAAVPTDPSGVATFTDLVITGLVGARSLRFDATLGGSPLTPGVSSSFTLTAGPATQVAASAGNNQSAPVATAVPAAPTVLVTDQSGNPVAGIGVAFAVGGGGGSVTGSNPITSAAGLASVGSWTLGTIAGPNTLTAAAPGLTGSPVTFTATGIPGPATVLDIVSQPASGGATVGVIFPDQPVVRRLDAHTNVVVSPPALITAAVAFGGGTLGGTAGVTTDATTGLATWTDLLMQGTAGTKALRFTSGSLAVTSASFSLAPGAASNLAIVTQPSSSVVTGNALAQQPVIQVRDAGGNPVAIQGVPVTATLTGAPAGITLGGLATVDTDVNGVATFSGLSLTGAVGTYTLTFTATGYVGVSSTPIVVLAGPPASFTATSPQLQTGRVGVAATSLPSVVVQDASGNPIAAFGVTFALTGGGGQIGGTAQVTDSLGRATLGSWTLGPTVVANTVTATASGFPVLTFTANPSFVVDRVAAGAEHSCATTVDGLGYCWGDNTTSALGDGTTTPRGRPTPMSGTNRYSQLAAGRGYSCGLTSNGLAFCWGANNKGQLGVGNTAATQAVPTAVSGGRSFGMLSVSLAPSDPHSCGTVGSQAYCWGSNLYGQLGNGVTSTGARTTPLQVPGNLAFAQIDAGVFYTCAALVSGSGRCWGLNDDAQLGDGTTTQRLSPTTVSGGLLFTAVAASVIHSCGLTTGGTVYCWGDNVNGRLGQDTLTVIQSPTPIQVQGLSSVVQLVAGEAHTCARTATSQVLCWGFGKWGQLGDGTFTVTQPVPTAVALPTGVTGFVWVAAGSLHTCGVTPSGAAYCWGENLAQQLGDGTTTDQPAPVPVQDP